VVRAPESRPRSRSFVMRGTRTGADAILTDQRIDDGALRVGPGFRRRSCCLIYRLAGTRRRMRRLDPRTTGPLVTQPGVTARSLAPRTQHDGGRAHCTSNTCRPEGPPTPSAVNYDRLDDVIRRFLAAGCPSGRQLEPVTTPSRISSGFVICCQPLTPSYRQLPTITVLGSSLVVIPWHLPAQTSYRDDRALSLTVNACEGFSGGERGRPGTRGEPAVGVGPVPLRETPAGVGHRTSTCRFGATLRRCRSQQRCRTGALICRRECACNRAIEGATWTSAALNAASVPLL
jgi:hypothetical protein